MRPCLCNDLAMRKLQTRGTGWGSGGHSVVGRQQDRGYMHGVLVVVVVPMSSGIACVDRNADTHPEPAS